MSLLNEFDRDEISLLLAKNDNRNFLNINFWNKRLFIDDYSKDKNNNLYYIGRLKDSVRVKGENISAWEIETTLNKNKNI